jgi:hypothetical protein
MSPLLAVGRAVLQFVLAAALLRGPPNGDCDHVRPRLRPCAKTFMRRNWLKGIVTPVALPDFRGSVLRDACEEKPTKC